MSTADWVPQYNISPDSLLDYLIPDRRPSIVKGGLPLVYMLIGTSSAVNHKNVEAVHFRPR